MKDVKRLLDSVFNQYAHRNILLDFEFMAKHSKLKGDEEMMRLCLLWFALGHINTLDKDSNFIKNFNGEGNNDSGLQ